MTDDITGLRTFPLDEEMMEAQRKASLEEFAELADLPTPVSEEDYRELEELRVSLGKMLGKQENAG